jgi:putative mRNA 3-end processing factor
MSVSATVEQFDFSAHADADGLRSYLSAYPDSEIVLNHGDETGRFATTLRAEDYNARTVTVGETINV